MRVWSTARRERGGSEHPVRRSDVQKTGYKRRMWNDGERRRNEDEGRRGNRMRMTSGRVRVRGMFLKGGRGGENRMSLKRPVLQDTTQTK